MPAPPEFRRVLDRWRDTEHAFPAADLYQFSDLAADELRALTHAWADIAVERRRGTLHDLAEIGEANFEVNFEAVFRLGLEDEDAEVRAAAIGGLWEAEAPDLIAPLLDLLLHDPAENVRTAAASALGRFVYLGEVEDISEAHARRIVDTLLAVAAGGDAPAVRRRALEALGYSSRAEVPPLIRAAYESADPKIRASAVFAMGRSADARWAPQVVAELESAVPELRFEAARAAGELELAEAVPALAQLAEDGDQQVRDAAIWSLGQVGGPAARRTLGRLLQQADEDEQDYIQDALDNLAFNDDLHSFSMFVFGEDDEGEGRPSLN